ncbi:MAG: WD40/YVTN/BNR-like repeat-containing protein [bacterium]
MFKKVLFTFSFVLLFSLISRAEWDSSGTQYSTHAIDISAAVDQYGDLRIFVADSTYRLYKSADYGVSWTANTWDSSSFNPSCVLAIKDTSIVYIGRYVGIDPVHYQDSAGVFRSIDNGDNWDFIVEDGFVNQRVISLAYFSLDPSYMFSGSDTLYTAGVQRPVFHWSSNGGVDWKPVPDDTPPMKGGPGLSAVFDVMFLPGDSTNGYGAAGRTCDPDEPGWGIWNVDGPVQSAKLKFCGDARALTMGFWGDSVQTLYAGIYSGDSAGVWRTTEADAESVSWDSLSGTMGYPITAIALDPTSIEDTLLSNDTLYVGTNGYGIMKSINGGSTWSFVNTGIYCKIILYIKVDPVNNNRVYAGAQWSFYVSTDYGQTWAERIQGMKKAQISGVGSNAPTKYCIGEFDNLYKSTDGA